MFSAICSGVTVSTLSLVAIDLLCINIPPRTGRNEPLLAKNDRTLPVRRVENTAGALIRAASLPTRISKGRFFAAFISRTV